MPWSTFYGRNSCSFAVHRRRRNSITEQEVVLRDGFSSETNIIANSIPWCCEEVKAVGLSRQWHCATRFYHFVAMILSCRCFGHTNAHNYWRLFINLYSDHWKLNYHSLRNFRLPKLAPAICHSILVDCKVDVDRSGIWSST